MSLFCAGIATLLLFAVLAWAATAKLVDPLPTTRFLGQLVHLPLPWLVQSIAIVEAVVALWLFSGLRRRAALLVVCCMFVAFALAHVYSWRSADSPKSCGCLGAAGGIGHLPHWVWIAGNAALALVAALTIWVSPEGRAGCAAPQNTASRSGRPFARAGAAAAAARGFTIIEMLVCILIVGVLVAIAIPALRAVMRDRNDTIDLSNMRLTILDFASYAAANTGEIANVGTPHEPDSRWYYNDSWGTEQGARNGSYLSQITTWPQVLRQQMDGGRHWHSSYEDFILEVGPYVYRASEWGGTDMYAMWNSKYRLSLTLLTDPSIWTFPGAGTTNAEVSTTYARRVRFEDVRNPSGKGMLLHSDYPGATDDGRRHIAFVDGSAAIRRLDEAKPAAAWPTALDPTRTRGRPVSATLDGYLGADY